jgi:hypothetical protein
MQHFYDGQIRRFVTQFIRAFSNFSYKDNAGSLRKVPCTYGNLTRQVANIIRDNSENKVVSAPRIAAYIQGLEYARDRIQNPTHVNKLNIRERQFDQNTQQYTGAQGPGYTVERLMPVPFNLQMKCDIWSTNTDQKLQIMEQILVLFNPSLEIQSTSNYIDWTSLSLIELTNVNFSTRSIPQGVDTEIDVGELTFTMPIWITPPAKVKKLGVIEKIVMSVFDDDGGIQLGLIDGEAITSKSITPSNLGMLVLNGIAKLMDDTENTSTSKDGVPTKLGEPISWFKVLDQYPGEFRAGISTIRLAKSDGTEVVATASVNPTNETELVLSFDADTVPENTVLSDSITSRGTVDAIIDPTSFNPETSGLAVGTRYLLLDDPNPNTFAWKDQAVGAANDIVTWNGSNWEITFDASANEERADSSVAQEPVYITNTYTGVQYKYTNETGAWLKSYEGEYPAGSWRIVL